MTFRIAGGRWRTHDEQSAAARRLLGELLGHEVAVEHDSAGAPYLPQSPCLHISISHCHTAVAVAVSEDGPVGIDIESRRKVSESLIARVCTAWELEDIHRNGDIEMAFLRWWTRKEAVLKCRGTGIKGFDSMIHALDISDIEVSDLPCDLPDTVAALAVVKAG